MNTRKSFKLMTSIFDYRNCRYLLVQAQVILCAYFVLFSIFYYFIFELYAQVNQSDDYFNRILQVKVTTITPVTDEQILKDVIDMPRVEWAYYTQIVGEQDILNILLKDFRVRNDVLYSLPSYFDTINVFIHQIEADQSRLVLFRNSGVLSVGILVLAVMVFMRNFSKKMLMTLGPNMRLLYILGYRDKLLWRLWIIPVILAMSVSLIGALIIQGILINFFINAVFREISFVERYGLYYDFNLKGIGYAYLIGLFSISFWIKNTIAKEIQNESLI